MSVLGKFVNNLGRLLAFGVQLLFIFVFGAARRNGVGGHVNEDIFCELI